jgi:3-hydroxyisobutyrate dehydrogenase-like beta-hydroxyacid dehydrogenase
LAICVADDAQVNEVVASALPYLRTGSLLVIHSTVDPETCVSIGKAAAERGVRVIDAPVSGGRQRAFEGRLTLMVGGDRDDVARARPIMETCSALIVHAGPLGSGQVLKLANNYLLAAQLTITRDAITLLEQFGLDVCESMRAIAASTGSSRIIESYVANGCENVFGRHSKGRTHGAGLLAKDIALVDAVASRKDARLPGTLDELVRTGLQIAFEAGAADDAQPPSVTEERASG